MSRRCSGGVSLQGLGVAIWGGLLLLFLLSCCCFLVCDGTMIAKSKITMCANDKAIDPKNVVDQKNCEKKLVLTKVVSAGETANDQIYVNISNVRDEVDQDEARLYNPFLIAVTQSPMTIIYPYKFKQLVNNKPYETSRRHYWCQDGAHASDGDMSCRVLRDKTTGLRVWNSQGFCCRCTQYEDFISSQGSRYHRGGTECGNLFNIPLLSWLFFKNHDRQSSHCMHYDKLYYEVHEVDTYQLFFKIFVKAYDVEEELFGGKLRRRLVEGGTITLTTRKTAGRGDKGRILATLIGMFEPNRQFSSLTEKFLMIPSRKSPINFKTHPQTVGGETDYMLIPKSYFALDNDMESCDKIGVSFTAFVMQGGHNGQGEGCTRHIGSCLNNQIKDLFHADKKRRDNGRRPLFFPEKYGEVLGTESLNRSSHALVYKIDQIISSTVTLEISADDIILIYNKATGIIAKAFATNFESLSRDGRLNVIAYNTGLVSADFYVTVKECTVGIMRTLEQRASINPQSTHMFALRLRTSVHGTDKHMCTAMLWDSRHNFLDSANVSFSTTKSCVCLQSCMCACTGTADVESCITNEINTEIEQITLKNMKLRKRIMNALQRFFYEVNESLEGISMVLFAPTFERVLRAWILMSLVFGLFKAKLGIQKGGGHIAYFGWWWAQPIGEERFVDKDGSEIMGVYDKDGDLIDTDTGRVLKTEKQILFIGNIFFFLLSICIFGVRAARLYKQIEERDKIALSLSNVALSGTTVYRNFTNFPDADQLLTNPGKEFSIAGKLERMNIDFKFTVVENMQVIEVVEDELMLLTPAVEFDSEIFSKRFDQDTALEEITLQPMFVCLNEEPTFDYYSEGEDELPPTPPACDYSMHDLAKSSSIYEMPVTK